MWEIELEPEVREWFEQLPPRAVAIVTFNINRLAHQGAALRMPHSRSLGDGLFELRFDIERSSRRITFFFPGERRIVLLTVFRKQRQNEQTEIARSRLAMKRCIAEDHNAHE